MKLWINAEYKGFSKEWIKRKIVKIKKGINIFISKMVVGSMNKSISFFVKSLVNYTTKLEETLDDYSDIKNNYLIVDKKGNDDVGIIICNDNEKKSL